VEPIIRIRTAGLEVLQEKRKVSYPNRDSNTWPSSKYPACSLYRIYRLGYTRSFEIKLTFTCLMWFWPCIVV